MDVTEIVFCLIFTHMTVFFKNHEVIIQATVTYIFFYIKYMFVLFEPCLTPG